MNRVWLFLSYTAGDFSESFEKGFPPQKTFSLSPNSKRSLIKEETFLSYPPKSTN